MNEFLAMNVFFYSRVGVLRCEGRIFTYYIALLFKWFHYFKICIWFAPPPTTITTTFLPFLISEILLFKIEMQIEEIKKIHHIIPTYSPKVNLNLHFVLLIYNIIYIRFCIYLVL
jgi:hypothetical protein